LLSPSQSSSIGWFAQGKKTLLVDKQKLARNPVLNKSPHKKGIVYATFF
jgi:hypothetical protein